MDNDTDTFRGEDSCVVKIQVKKNQKRDREKIRSGKRKVNSNSYTYI